MPMWVATENAQHQSILQLQMALWVIISIAVIA